MTTSAKRGLLWTVLFAVNIAWGHPAPDALLGTVPPDVNGQSPAAAQDAAQTSPMADAGRPASEDQRGTRAPNNNECANAYAFDLYVSSPVTFTDDNTGATEDCSFLSGGIYGEAWYRFTTYESLRVAITYCGTTPAFCNAYIVMDTTCPCSGAFIFATTWENAWCGDGNWSLCWNNLPAGTYYWPLLTDSMSGCANGPYTVTFDASPPVPECSPGSLYGQSPTDPASTWSANASAITTGFSLKVCEDFYYLGEKIGELHWWGLSLLYNGGWDACDPTGMTFEIAFYQDNAGTPGSMVVSYLVAPTIESTGLVYGGFSLYCFSAPELLPCALLGGSTGWVSIQSQPNPADCAFLWMSSPMGDCNAYQDQGGVLVQLATDMSFCLIAGTCPEIRGACCDDDSGVCYDNVDLCPPPLRFMPNVLCPDLDPPCGILGACCDAGLSCLFTGFESECHAIQGRFFAGQSCPDFVCPPDCTHRIDLHDCYGDGWNGNTLDVLVNGVAVLSQVTLPRGAGPLSYDFEAGGGDSIQTIYYPNGEWTYEPYYYIYDGLGSVLGSDGVSGTNCYVLPTGITVTGNCTPPTTGACCYFAGGCDMEPDWAHCIAGKFLGLGRQCSGCPCSVPCPPGAIPEPEPCGDYHDNGCYMGSPAFAPIACGDTICGTLWSNYDGRDADWYQIVTTDPTYFIWTAEAQVPVLIFVIQGAGPNDCSSYTVLGGAMASECQPATIISVCQQPGTYWFWVGPSAWNDWPCEKNYTATLTCPACDLPIGACCGECTACTLEVEPICTTQGGVWLGQNVPCDPSPCAAFYCWAGAQVCDEYISRVQIGTIDNSSGCEPNAQPPQYADYTALSADLPVGIGSPLVVTNGNPDWPGDHCAVWVDWNHDCVFEPTERVAVLSGAGPYAFTIAPPIGMPLGRTWMRVRISRVSTPQPCGIESYGEVEDYSLNMVELAGACCWSDRTCTLELPSECDGAFQGVGTTCDAQPCGCRGDLNCDGNVNFGDINPFVMILGNRSAWQQSFPGCPWRNGDTDGNGRVGFEDINPFVALLVAGGGVCP